MHGLHLTADLHGCRCAPHWLTDADALGRACLDAVAASGLQAVGQVFHTFPDTAHGPGGVTATVLLADMGADVVKIEPLAGDSTRSLGHAAHPGMASLFAS